MTLEIAAFLVIFVIALILFSVEWFSPDVVALGLMLTLIVTGLLPADAAFAGFGSETVLMILGLLILTQALITTGIVDITGRYILQRIGPSPVRLTSVVTLGPAILSSFISNTAAAAFFTPIALGLARRAKLSVSRTLMPVAFGAILASSVTLIGTSTNLVVSGLMQQQGMAPITMFELTPVGLPILIFGLLYMRFIGQRLIPDRTGTAATDSEYFDRPLYFSEVVILPGSPAVGKSIEESFIMGDLHLGVLQLRRRGELLKPLADTILEPDDTLMVEGVRDDILAIQNTPGVTVKGAAETLSSYIRDQTAQTAEVILLPGSPLIGRTIRGLQLRERYKLQILAINHSGRITYSKIGRHVLRLGDVLLVQMPAENLRLLEADRLFRVLDIFEEAQHDIRRALLAIGIFIGSLLLAVLNIFSIAVSVLIGALLVFVTRCIKPEEAYRNIEWKTLILIGCMLAFGRAMQETGTASYLADWLIRLAGNGSPLILLSLFFWLAVIITQPMSNQATAAILVPVAVQAAVLLNLNPRTFAVMIAVAASTSFITPLEPACVIVYAVGKYKFMDFIKVGSLLTVVVFMVAIILVPLLWPVV